MLMPKKTKYRKAQKGRVGGRAKGGRSIEFGEFGLVVTEPGRITSRQIESIRVTISRKLKKVGRLFLRMFPDKPVSKKPAETRMGKGKGNVEEWVFIAKRGRVLCEIGGLTKEEARDVLRGAACKLPIRTRFVEKNQLIEVNG